MEQETLIYIDDKQKYDASVVANTFSDKDIKNRAYINTLGSELVAKYLESENISISDAKNIHSIKKVLEEFDVSDIRLSNITLDVRVVFDENAIFIPKSHFDYNLLPDIYVVLKLEKDFSSVKILGFFEPKLINKNNANADYYFVEKEKLNSPLDLSKYVKSHNSEIKPSLSEDEIQKSEAFILSMIDKNITDADKKYLLKQLIQSSELRDKFIEYENFESLSYKAMRDPLIDKHEPASDISSMDEFEAFDNDLSNLAENSDDKGALDDLLQEENNENFVEPLVDASLAAGSVLGAAAAETDLAGETFDITDDILETLGKESEEDNKIEIFEEPKESSFDNELVLDDLEQIENIENKDNEEFQENINESEVISLGEDLPEIRDEDIQKDEIESLSLDNVEFEQIEKENDIIQEEKISLDEIELNEKEKISEDLISEDLDTISLDEEAIDLNPQMEEEIYQEDEKINLNEIDEKTRFDSIIEDDEIQTETISLDAIDENNKISEEEEISAEFAEDINEEEKEEKVPDSFGKNLLENLSADDIDDITIEEFPTEDNTEVGEISSDELLSQIDDVISSSGQIDDLKGETPVTEEHSKPQSDYIETILDDDFDAGSEDDLNKLNLLYNEDENLSSENDNIEEMEEIPNQSEDKVVRDNKKRLIFAAVAVVVLAAATVFSFVIKPKNNQASDYDKTVNIPVENTDMPADINSEDNILESNAPISNKDDKNVSASSKEIKELKNTVSKKTVHSGAYMSVNRIVWDVPDNLSYNKAFQNFLRTAGKSIKVSLSADLLLANEYAYNNFVKMNLNIGSDGSIKNISFVQQSGSKQIDNIVLQSVKETLNVIKPPVATLNGKDCNLNLIIYF